MENIKTVSVYKSDLEKLRSFKEQKKLQTLQDAVRICVEFAQSHGVFK